MAFAAAKAAVQIGAFAGVALQGTPDQVQGLVETPHQLRRDHVRAQGVGWPRHALGEAQDKIALVHLGGNVKDVADGGHIRTLFASFTGIPTIHAPYTWILSLFTVFFLKNGFLTALSSITSTLLGDVTLLGRLGVRQQGLRPCVSDRAPINHGDPDVFVRGILCYALYF